jgi:LytS/YehU family sensor histidine kinase
MQTSITNECLVVKIRNSGQLLEKTDTDSGLGVKNVLQRLHLLYGDNSSLKIYNENVNNVITELIIPKNLKVNEGSNN